MTTRSYSSVIAQTNDATFRAWGAQLSSELQAAGLVQTADTGQINWGTVTRPVAINTAAGFEMYRHNDALQATAPLFIKLEYGSASNVATPNLWITVGTGTNGAGTITGQASTRVVASSSNLLASTVTVYPTYICVKDGHFGLQWKVGAAASAPQAFFFATVSRTVDDTGAETGDGFTVIARLSGNGVSATPRAQAVSVSNATTFTASEFYTMVMGAVSSSDVGSDKQVYKCYTIQPRVRPMMQVCTALVVDYPAATTFTAALVGASSRTYLSGGTGTNYVGANTSVSYCAAMLWE